MNGPAKNHLHDYEAGWLTLLVSMRVATEDESGFAHTLSAGTDQPSSSSAKSSRSAAGVP